MRKILSVTMIFVLMLTLTTGTAFAAAGTTANGNEVPVYLNAPAIGDGDGGIDFTITDSITMTASAGSTVLTIDSLTVTNNSEAGQLKIDSLEASAEAGWTIKADDADYFANLKADTNQFSLVSEGNDFAETSELSYGESKLVAANGGSQTIAFSGHAGTFKTAVQNVKVAKVVATVSVY